MDFILRKTHDFRPEPRRERRGFALLVTIVLVAFLVLIIVALASFTRVETQVAANGQALAQARQNALMGLNVAIGQLQKYAGPDTRVTARSEIASAAVPENPYFTGVWDTTVATLARDFPMTWLVSGNELSPVAINQSSSLARTDPEPEVAIELDANGLATNGPGTANPNRVRLVGANSALTSGIGISNGAVVVPGVPINAAVPGFSGQRTVGRFAYWVSDEATKVAMALSDRTGEVDYAPYSTDESRRRLRQQAAMDTRLAGVDMRSADNAGLADNVLARPQFGFLTPDTGEASVAAQAREYFHDWGLGAYGVLANTINDTDATKVGLRRDLSLRPAELGQAFEAYTNYSAYMEPIPSTEPAVPAILPESPRRRYRITAPVTDAGITHSVAPVLSMFALQFNVRRQGTTSNLEVRTRMIAALWNPYSSAIIPEELVLEVSGLPTLQVSDGNGGTSSIDLQSVLGSPMRIVLTPNSPTFAGAADVVSWLPGRVYYWRTNGGGVGAWNTEFYHRGITVPNAVVWTVPTSATIAAPVSNSVLITVSGPPSQLNVRMRRSSDNEELASYTGPQYPAFNVSPVAVNGAEYRIGLPFRLTEVVDTVANPGEWLSVDGRDPRDPSPVDGAHRHFPLGDSPALYSGSLTVAYPDRLIDRVMRATVVSTNGLSYNEDAPLFELPRQPLLSLGELQHLQVENRRPFSIGNSWGVSQNLNRTFDRYFFSGLSNGAAPDLELGEPLPNTRLKPIAAKPDGSAVDLVDLMNESTTGYSSKYLLQGAAFNINSVSTVAWRAVLRSLRFPSGAPFQYVNAVSTTGTTADDLTPATQTVADGAFFRFPQTAQETFKADVPAVSEPHTDHFRKGMRELSAAEFDTLAQAIVTLIKAKHELSGPFKSLEEFLNPIADSPFGGVGLLEKAISDAQLNNGITGLSSQFLTQADIMSALAPVLFARSDTFLIRTYGEVINPATGVMEGRAWCEAVVQRFPEPLAAANSSAITDIEYRNPPGDFGRRFKIISFRWLTTADI